MKLRQEVTILKKETTVHVAIKQCSGKFIQPIHVLNACEYVESYHH